PVLVLMGQAAARGIGAFSEGEAARRGVPWLDLVRDPRQRAALGTLAAELHRRAFVPEALRALVTPGQAKERWAALREFARTHGHWPATGGPITVHSSVLGPNDEAAAAGTSRDVQTGRVVADLAGRLRPGAYRVLVALALNGNLVNPEVKVLPYRVGD